MHSLWLSSDINSYDQTSFVDQDLMKIGQLKMLDPTRKYQKYLSFKGLSKSQNYGWQNMQDGVFE